jgi:hypothetical protein
MAHNQRHTTQRPTSALQDYTDMSRERRPLTLGRPGFGSGTGRAAGSAIGARKEGPGALPTCALERYCYHRQSPSDFY